MGEVRGQSETVHNLAGLSNATEVGSSHCLRVLSVGGLWGGREGRERKGGRGGRSDKYW